MLEACTDPQTQRWTTVPVPYTAEHARSYVHEHVPAGWASGTELTFAVCDSTTGTPLGSIALRLPPGETAEIGFWAHPDARGRGVMTDAVGALCRWAFAVLGLPQVIWRAEAGNEASRRVAEKSGFTVGEVQPGALPGRQGPVDAWVATLVPRPGAPVR